MTTTINADNVTGGAIVTGDASGQLGLQAAGVTKLTVSSSGVTLATPLPVASGGTGGSATPTAGGIVYGTGTVQAVTAAGTSGQYLQSNAGSAPTWSTVSAGFTLGTPVNASGTSVSFTGIPAGIKQIVMTFSGISTNGTGGVIIQIGDSGGFETTGTNSTGTKIIVGTADTDNGGGPEIGFFIYSNLTVNTLWGSVILTLHNSTTFTWAAQGVFSSGSGSTFTTAGRKSLSAELDRIRIITPNGTDTFDDGSVNIAYI
jgi:hypothetical protein